MTATSTTIPPARKDMPAPLGKTPKKIFSSLVLKMFGLVYGYDPAFTENTDPDQDGIFRPFIIKKLSEN
jgi:hypothetical protein